MHRQPSLGLAPFPALVSWNIYAPLVNQYTPVHVQTQESTTNVSSSGNSRARRLLAQHCLSLLVKLHSVQKVVIPERPLSEYLSSVLQHSNSSQKQQDLVKSGLVFTLSGDTTVGSAHQEEISVDP